MTQTPDSAKMISARRTESFDAANIQNLATSATEALFGRTNVINLIERSLLAITLNNELDEVLAHAAFLDYPNVKDVDKALWYEDWFTKYYQYGQCTTINTVFLHYLVAKPDYAHGCAQELIRTLFNAIPDVHFCILAVPLGVTLDESLNDLFTALPLASEYNQPSTSADLFIAYRRDHVPVLNIRTAKVEDSDDLVPIFNGQTDMLTKTYGDYFLAELIESQDENMKCLVAEVQGTAVGFMSLSSDVNVELLNKCFELGPFHGLCVPHPSDITSSQNGDKRTTKSSRASSAGNGRDIGPDDGESSLAFNTSGDASELVLKRKLSEDQRPGSSLSDNMANELAQIDASSRILSTSKSQQFSKPSLLVKQNQQFIPVYKGQRNAFSIQLFCIDERFETRSCDFLLKAFECFPDCEYCIISVPHSVPEFPLLQQFVRVTPRMSSTLAQELYVYGVAGLRCQFNVRLCDGQKDMDGIENLVKTLTLGNDILDDVRQYKKNRIDRNGVELLTFVAEVSKQIVGVAVIRQEQNIEYVRSHYNIEDFIYFNHHRREEHGHLHHYALNPAFKHFSKYFIKEILRIGNKTCIYYPIYPAYTSRETLAQHSLVAALGDMVPVRARRQIVYPVDQLGINAPSKRVLKEEEQYALNHVNCKLVLEPKVTLNVRVVVVGASDVGMAFLETFAFSPHLRFNNLTLISPHGMPGELPPNELRDGLLSTSHCYSQKEYDQMALRTWVNVVCGKMTGIDRKKKYVIVNDCFTVPYDHLVLCTGTQYQLPKPTGLDINVDVDHRSLPNPEKPQPRYEGKTPPNAFTVNDSYDAAVLLYWIENNVSNSGAAGKVVIYGSSLDVYCCVQTLLMAGVAGEKIVIVEPPTDSEVSCFNNPTVEEAVMNALADAGVEVYSGYLLAQWNEAGDSVDEIYSASFTSDEHPLTLDCVAFISFYARMVDYDAFMAMNCACLVYDGRLVIDTNFHTNDDSIRAAGSLTKYQRIYHSSLTHADFSSKEIGIQLALALLSLFDPTLEPARDQQSAEIRLVPIYRQPKIRGGILPGGFQYLHVEKPVTGKIALAQQMSSPDYGRELITGKPAEDPEYFRLHINQFNCVETITCLSTRPFARSNLLTLYGVHQRYLNNLVSRYFEGFIADFYSYFNESWAMAIFHDRFTDFREEIRELLVARSDGTEESLEEIIRQQLDDDITRLNEGQKTALKNLYVNNGIKRAVETHFLSYLHYNYYHLTMYAKPGMV